MGVIYKLRDSVVDFIINKKVSDPLISCRKLAPLIHEAFQISVSKSSINAVIKEAKLSSPVGRPSRRSARKQKFKIPLEKKQQLLTALTPMLLTVSDTQPAASDVPRETAGAKQPETVVPLPPPPDEILIDRIPAETPVPLPANMESQTAAADDTIEKDDDPGQRPLSLMADPLAAHQELPVDEQPSKPETVARVTPTPEPVKLGPAYPGMGAVVVQAVIRDLGLRVFLQQLAGSGGTLSVEDIAVIEALVCAGGVSSGATVEHICAIPDGVWVANGIPVPVDPERIRRTMEKLSAVRMSPLDLALGWNGISARAQNVAILLEDKTELFIDGRRTVIGTQPSTNVRLSVPVEQLIQNLPGDFINGLNPLVLDRVPGDQGMDPCFLSFVAACQNIGGKAVVKLDVRDERGVSIAEFTSLPRQKRFFIIGANPQQLPGTGFENTQPGERQSMKLSWRNGEQWIFERDVTIGENPATTLRAVATFDKAEGVPAQVILTNLTREQATTRDVATLYFESFSGMGNLQPKAAEGPKLPTPPNANDSLMELIGGDLDFYNILQSICLRTFLYAKSYIFSSDFPWVDFKSWSEALQKISGRIAQDNNKEHIRLLIPTGYEYIAEFNTIIHEINALPSHSKKLLLLIQ